MLSLKPFRCLIYKQNFFVRYPNLFATRVTLKQLLERFSLLYKPERTSCTDLLPV